MKNAGGEQILCNGEFFVDNSAKVHIPKLSTIYTLGANKNDPNGVDFNNIVELIENNLHPITEELKRWQLIIGERYIDHKLEEQRNSLAYKPEGYTITISKGD